MLMSVHPAMPYILKLLNCKLLMMLLKDSITYSREDIIGGRYHIVVNVGRVGHEEHAGEVFCLPFLLVLRELLLLVLLAPGVHIAQGLFSKSGKNPVSGLRQLGSIKL